MPWQTFPRLFRLFTGQKTAYICGPLTELKSDQREAVKKFYERLADVYESITGIRAFVPHEHYDPVMHAQFTPQEIDLAERWQVMMKTSLLIAVAIEPTWGGGIEVEMANRSGVPAVVVCPEEKLHERKISRLLRGNPTVSRIIAYSSHDDALSAFTDYLRQTTFSRNATQN